MAVPQNRTCFTHRTRFWIVFNLCGSVIHHKHSFFDQEVIYLQRTQKFMFSWNKKMRHHLVWDETPKAHLISSYNGLIWIHNCLSPLISLFSPIYHTTLLCILTFVYLLNPNFNMRYQWKIPTIPHFFTPHVNTSFNLTAGVLMY